MAANGVEFCEECRDQVRVLKNEENSPSRIIERAQKNPNPLDGKKIKRGGVTTKRIQNNYLNSLNELSLVVAIPSVIVRSAISSP